MSASGDIELPAKLRFLFEPCRYKVAYGGRGGSKSWAAARALLIQGAAKPLRILCAREFQNSISDSVHALLSDQVKAMGLDSFYEVQKNTIIGRNGTTLSYEGLRHNATKLKSYEGADICWVEEAQTVSKASWEILIPTIRKEGSEIWLTFNPSLETDETYQRFVLNPPPGAQVVKVNWDDNPWFPEVLREEMEYLKQKDPDAYLNVWEGHCRQILDGAVYAKELRTAQEDGRITNVPVEQNKPVDAFFDLGRADKTAIWFVQQVGLEFRIIDFYEDRGFAWHHYLKKLRERNYLYGTIYLPHDGAYEQLASERTIEQQTSEAGFSPYVLPRASIEAGIEAARLIFNRCWFDKARCADGLQALRHYRYDIDELGQWSKRPLHDDNSHAADAFRYFASSMQEQAPRKPSGQHAASWLG
jgi:phage terminase large subunit